MNNDMRKIRLGLSFFTKVVVVVTTIVVVSQLSRIANGVEEMVELAKQ